ncbi:MAG TPA: DUF4388 domain-containing protein [Pyrinomonadaceae bacterium]|jgi:hypothetical protein|nr:DUF4388 domain-containing protein [Pyrinomonadaceae bacterium]
MQSNRFVVLTGHLSNYPLSDLVGILRHQRKSGRLLIEYPKGPAMFFFQDGELMDARLNELSGLQAICVALAQPESSFNFNPLIQSPRRSIEPSLQRAVSELFGCWDESALQIEATTTPQPEVLALPPAPPVLVRQRSVLLIAAAVLIVVGLSTVIAVTGGFSKNETATAASLPQNVPQPAPVAAVPSELPVRKAATETITKPNRAATERKEEKRSKPEAEPAPEPEPASQAIRVVMQIENGRVLKAAIANPKPGMDSYEAMALRIARQRRYPTTLTGGETVTINVNR